MKTARLTVTCLAIGLLSACGGSTPGADDASPSPVAACATSDLTVTLTAGTVRAVNTSGHACALAGVPGVAVPWWRTVGPGPLPATGTLDPGSALIQAYKPEASNGCPGGSLAEGVAQLTVTVENHAYLVSLPADEAYEIQTCDVVSALPARIETSLAAH